MAKQDYQTALPYTTMASVGGGIAAISTTFDGGLPLVVTIAGCVVCLVGIVLAVREFARIRAEAD